MTAPAPAPAETGRTPVVIRWLVAATFTVILNETIMINAIPSLAEHFDVSLNAAQWLSTAFLLTMASVIPVTGWFLQRVSTRTAFATAMITFSIGTALALVAPTFWVLLVARIIQASGTAVMMPLLMTTLMTVVPMQDRGRVMGNVTLAMSVAPALGPAVSGVLLQLGSWRLIFAAVLPIALAVTVVSMRKLENVGEPKPGDIDWPSVAIAALGFGGLVYGLSEFANGDRLRPGLIVAVGLVAIALFVTRQLRLMRNGSPLLDLRVLRHRTYRLSLIMMSIAFMAMLGAMILLPLYLQEVRELSPLKTGLLVMPGGLAMGVLGPRVGAAFDRFGSKPLVIPGSIVMVLSLVAFTQIGAETPYALILGNHVLMMLSLAMLFTPVFTLGLGDVPMHLYSHGSSMLGTIQQVAGAFGTALVITLMTSHAKSQLDDGVAPLEATIDGMQLAFLVSALIAVAVVVLAFMLPSRPAVDPHAGPAPEEKVGDLDAELEELEEDLGELSPGTAS
jgi:MFS transporter, DHA2 family, lincomycin resistance protein